MDASMNSCDLKNDSFGLKIIYNHGKMDVEVDGVWCKSMSYNLEEYEIVMKATNLRQAKNLVKIDKIS